MTHDIRNEILLVALVVSVGLHVGTMAFAKKLVMTHGASAQVAKVMRKGPMRVVRAAPPPPPVKIEAVSDLPASKDAPEVENAPQALAPETAEESRPSPALDVPPSNARPPEPEDRAVFDAHPVDMDVSKERPTFPMTPIETPRAAAVLAAPQAAAPTPAEAKAAAPAVPAFGIDDSSLFSPTAEERRSVLREPAPLDKRAGEKFVPAQEVTEKVDEKLVEREKTAVLELFEQEETVELAKSVNVTMTASTVGGWKYFRVMFVPRHDLQTVPKDVVVLIDASGSIGKDRIKSVREAAKQILRDCMNTDDRFNLVAFRDRYAYASKRWLDCDQKSFDFADGWLGNIAAHGRTDVFATISSVLTLPRDPSRPLIALVVTDGDANSGVHRTAEILSRFTALNDGLISVYMYGVKDSANRELIDLLTHGNRGESFIYDGWLKWKTGSELGSLTARFRDPVLSDLRVVFSSGTKADAYPRRLRNLYRGDTLDFVGRVPADVREIAFSLRGLNGKTPYESFFRLPLATAATDDQIPVQWEKERQIDQKLGGK